MNTVEILAKQLEVLNQIAARMDTMIDGMKKDLNIREMINDHEDIEVVYIPKEHREWVGSFNFVNSIDAIPDEQTRKISYDFNLLAQDAIIKELRKENEALKDAYDVVSGVNDRLLENRRTLVERIVELRKELSIANKKLIIERVFHNAKR